MLAGRDAVALEVSYGTAQQVSHELKALYELLHRVFVGNDPACRGGWN